MKRKLVVLVDSNDIFRRGCRSIFDEDGQFEVIDDAESLEDLQEQARRADADLVVLDADGGGEPDASLVQRACAIQPSAAMLMLTSQAKTDFLVHATKAGASAVLLKPRLSGWFLLQVAAIVTSSDATVLDRGMLSEWMQQPVRVTPASTRNSGLTSRETEVLSLLAGGLSDEAVARHLVIARTTIHTHISSILTKVRASNRVQLGIHAERAGLLYPVPYDQDMRPGH